MPRQDHNPKTVDFSQTPDLVVVYYGMPAKNLQGVFTVLGLRKRVSKALMEDPPEGLLRHEFLYYSFLPLHIGMRQYWKDFESLVTWARKSAFHLSWWKNYVNDSEGTGFWHETYCLQGGMEAVYNDMAFETGLMGVAPVIDARGKELKMAKSRLETSRQLLKPRVPRGD
jgi:hypothetical protein